MDLIINLVLGGITTAIAVFSRKEDAKSKRIVKALKIASAGITAAIVEESTLESS